MRDSNERSASWTIVTVTRALRAIGGSLLALLAAGAAAQDVNYWNIQHGPVGQLLGGQVIASSRDLTATFYNPGGLALEEESTFLLSTESFQAGSFSTTPSSDLALFETASTRFSTAPTLVAGALPRSWLGEGTRLAWSFLTLQELKVGVGKRLEDPFDLPGGRSAAELISIRKSTRAGVASPSRARCRRGWGSA